MLFMPNTAFFPLCFRCHRFWTPPSMQLLDYDRVCRIDHKKAEGPSGLILLYEKTADSYSIVEASKAEVDETLLVNFLKNTQAEEKNCVRLHYCSDKPFQFIALSALKKSNREYLLIEAVRKAAIKGMQALKSSGVKNFVLGSMFLIKEQGIACILALYKYDILKKKEKVECHAVSALSECPEFVLGAKIAYFHNFSRFLGDTPANLMTPQIFCDYAAQITKDLPNVSIEVFKRDYMQKNGMNLLLSVAQGSAQEPRLLVVKYLGSKDNNTNLCLVGKGVTFDSGGISIKGASKMAEMKADMLGAAAVLSTLCLCASENLNINVLVTIPLTENLPSGTATKPGDVFISMSGKSVEVDNTDAEGRLILADALTHAQKHDQSIKHIVDVATLTGAMTVALGNVFSGLFCEDEDFTRLLVRCGEETDDPVWPMPLSDRYRPATDSHVADIRNVGSPGSGGSCTAAIFLKEFIESKTAKWAHIDIASTMNNSLNKEMYGSGMSGRPVMLLFRLCQVLADQK